MLLMPGEDSESLTATSSDRIAAISESRAESRRNFECQCFGRFRNISPPSDRRRATSRGRRSGHYVHRQTPADGPGTVCGAVQADKSPSRLRVNLPGHSGWQAPSPLNSSLRLWRHGDSDSPGPCFHRPAKPVWRSPGPPSKSARARRAATLTRKVRVTSPSRRARAVTGKGHR